MNGTSLLRTILRADPMRWDLLEVVRALDLPDSWIGAGFARNAVWDHLHQRPPSSPAGDVDVIWYDQRRADRAEDLEQEAILRAAMPEIAWSVKNQARMHQRNGDAPYASAVDAMRYWPETATAVAVRRLGPSSCHIAAPFGLDDLFSMILKPSPSFSGEKRRIFEDRVRTKGWVELWPHLRIVEA